MKLHYVFGMARDFGGKPWSYVHYLSVATAVAVNKPDEVVFWHDHEPHGRWWDATKPLVTLRQIKAPDTIFDRPLVHPAHKADVVRLQALIDEGGVYLDADVWCLKPFSELPSRAFWMGRQGRNYGLCNATMGGKPGSAFAKRWLGEYATFRSRGRDQYWDEHSVRLPLRLADENPRQITIHPESYFFAPLWGRITDIFSVPAQKRRPIPAWLDGSYSVHLWESKSWTMLRRLTPENLKRDSEVGRRLDALGVL